VTAVRILVSAASKHGSTAEVANHIRETLLEGLSGDVAIGARGARIVAELGQARIGKA
jgi:menaquinone-dependent protoporphyrinogen IX oxidase